MTTSKRSDDQLIDLLDEALRDFKQDALVNSSAWRMSHPELGEEGFGLLETLTALSSSIDIVGSPTAEELSSFAEQNDATWIGDAYPGKKIARYDVLAHVGAGAMGNVFKAHDPKLDRVVAIKMPHWENLSREPEIAKERFLREARAAAGVRHAHVCPIYDAGESDGQPFVVMAFIDGEPLDAILKRGLMEDSRRAVRIVAEVAEGLGEVHRFGIIHRDLKPGNILIDRSGRANLTDFGLALSTVQTDRLTNDGIVIGTPVYMSPEQAAGENSALTPAADIYSLGAVLYELLTGQPPFRAPIRQLLRQIVLQPPVSPLQLRPDLDPCLAAIAMRALEKAPADRFASADDFSQALRDWLEQKSVAVSPAGTAINTVPAVRWSWLSSKGIMVVIAIGVILMGTARLIPDGSGSISVSGDVASDVDTRAEVIPKPLQVELTATVTISLLSDPVGGGIATSPVRIDSEGAVPLRNGDRMSLDVHLNRPGYIYLIWIDSDGAPVPLYPWDTLNSKAGWDAPLLNWALSPMTEMRCPQEANTYLEAGGKQGVQHILFLARSTPLEPPYQLKSILGNLTPTPLSNIRELASMEWSRAGDTHLRGFVEGKTARVNVPTFEILKERLKDDFELIKVWRFAQTEL